MRVNRLLMPIIFIVVFGGTILLAQAAGLWTVSGRTSVDLETLTAADLKGWMTLQQVIDGIGISKQDLYALVNIPDDVPVSTALKDIEKIVPGFETSTLRDALDAWQAGTNPLATQGATGDGTPPVVTLAATATVMTSAPTPESAITAAATHNADGSGTGPMPLPAGQGLPAAQIKGSLTLRQVSEQSAVSLDAVLNELKLPPETSVDMPIKTLIAQSVLSEVTQVRDAVARLQAK
jgi:hypothetical protein